jgi:hypothetical protein
MHLPALFEFHLKPHFRLVWWFLGYMLVPFLHFHWFIASQSAGFTSFWMILELFEHTFPHPGKTGDLKCPYSTR